MYTLPKQNSRDSVFLIGGGGFIGSAIAQVLIDQGSEVRALQHRNPVSTAGVQPVHGDIRTFKWEQLNANLPDVILHSGRISGRTLPGRMLAAWQGYKANNRLVEWIGSHQNPPYLLFVSGTLVYGSNQDNLIDEEAPLSPVGFQKFYLRAEMPLLNAFQSEGLPILSCRAPWVLDKGSWFAQFYLRIMENEGYIPLYGDGLNWMAITHRKDCAGLIVHLAHVSQQPGVINLVTHPPVRQETFCGMLHDLTGLPVRRITYKDLRIKYGKTVADSLTFSLKLASNRPELETYLPRYVSLKEAIEQVIGPKS